ncbi:hypothetical protein NDU88_002671 [Pleurodeles waltl]|uniref:Uncharacterized protein n=1 Tax=Pleurodeles waltl TaxID=8319 RepID=A0AAV7MNS4_PLEWA|nr:hypothetical protein NDU88_002671 [Pleurodeles waltl]
MCPRRCSTSDARRKAKARSLIQSFAGDEASFPAEAGCALGRGLDCRSLYRSQGAGPESHNSNACSPGGFPGRVGVAVLFWEEELKVPVSG